MYSYWVPLIFVFIFRSCFIMYGMKRFSWFCSLSVVCDSSVSESSRQVSRYVGSQVVVWVFLHFCQCLVHICCKEKACHAHYYVFMSVICKHVIANVVYNKIQCLRRRSLYLLLQSFRLAGSVQQVVTLIYDITIIKGGGAALFRVSQVHWVPLHFGTPIQHMISTGCITTFFFQCDSCSLSTLCILHSLQ